MAVFFLKYHQICPAARVLPQDPGMLYALVAPVFSARFAIETFCKNKNSIFKLITPLPPSLNKI